MSPLLTLEEAQAKLLALAPTMPVEYTTPELSQGLYLANYLPALRTQPAADLSAMDGYAIAGSGPRSMVGVSRAGKPYVHDLSDGECTRISTGAHMPGGADRD